jgi:hypothetical protein
MNHMLNQTSRNVHAISAQTGAVVNMFLHFARTKMRDALTGRERTCTTALLTLRKFIAYVLNIEPEVQHVHHSRINENSDAIPSPKKRKIQQHNSPSTHLHFTPRTTLHHSASASLHIHAKTPNAKKGNVPPIPQLRSIFSRTYVVEKEERLVFLYGAGNGRLFIA